MLSTACEAASLLSRTKIRFVKSGLQNDWRLDCDPHNPNQSNNFLTVLGVRSGYEANREIRFLNKMTKMSSRLPLNSNRT